VRTRKIDQQREGDVANSGVSPINTATRYVRSALRSRLGQLATACRKVPGADIANGVSIRLLSRRKQIPRARDTLEIERATLRKFQSGPRDQIGHDARYKYLIWA
jgi:hypothetical protein